MHITRQLWRGAGSAAAIATVLVAPATAGATNRVDALQSRVARLEKTVASLNTTVKKLQASLKTSNTSATTVKHDVATLETSVAAAVTAIGTVQTDLAAVKPGAAKGACLVNLMAYHWWSNYGFVDTNGTVFAGPGMAPDASASPTGYLAGIDPTCAAPLGLTRIPAQATAEQVRANARG
jgi:gas vesicle protein